MRSGIAALMLGSAGCQPAADGSLPSARLKSARRNRQLATLARAGNVLGRLPSTTGWQPALPGIHV